jgi:two-component system sensor histidine kinase KdpD
LRTALLDSVTHGLRTPLTSIKASVTSLLSDSGLNEVQRQDLLTVINEESDRLNRLVGEAAEMAQLDSGEVKLKLEPHRIDDIVSAALGHCKTSLGKRTVRVQVPPGLPRVRADLTRAREVLIHLIENANQYSPPGEPVTITADVTGNLLVTSVADHGSGITTPSRA